MTDLNKLRELAEVATQGPWYCDECDPADGHALAWIGKWFIETAHRMPYADQQADASFIAAANPAAIIALLDRLEAAERDAKRFDWLLTNAHLGIGRLGMDWELTVPDVPIPAPENPEIRQWIDAAMKEQSK